MTNNVKGLLTRSNAEVMPLKIYKEKLNRTLRGILCITGIQKPGCGKHCQPRRVPAVQDHPCCAPTDCESNGDLQAR